MQVALIEDDEQTRARTEQLFEAASTTADPIHVLPFASAEAFEFAQVAADVLVLDIKLPGADGMTLAKAVRKVDSTVPLAFVSNYDEYVFEGYDVNALAYIMKPLTAAKVATIIAKVRAQKPAKQLLVTTAAGAQRIPLYELTAIEVADHALAFHLQDQTLVAAGQLKDYLSLEQDGFIRIYRSILVNLNFVRRVTTSEVEMADGTHYPIARQERKRTREAFFAHYRRLADDD
ncbi:LytR/AlgR family response regulator transcription factor [Lacticaseibacillus hegangensis]|uniref:LytR/AlgR family response regulator transcription factor n=1 Tax=Lacticaseibacillus hegangensis TaxID=2486010 RepID=A0ABW4CW58_9LACO|nr:LytTR family DNA-binding domain-containing protein [Lacticaseibacillus hegangensis]